MASIDPATWTPWNLANLIWLHGKALYFHHNYLSKLAGNLPSELQQIHRRTTSLSFSLLELGEVLREKRFRVLDTDQKNSREILQMVEVVTAALFGIIHGVYKLKELPEATILDSVWSYVGLPTPLDDWKTEKERLMSETNDISSSLADFNHVVTASNAKKASEICDRLERLEESVKQRTSWLAGLFGGRLARRKPKSVDRADRDDHLTLADLKERARAYVENLCKTNETYRWYKYG